MRWLILLFLVAPLTAACIGDDDDTASASGAEDFAIELGNTNIRGQWGRSWESLHPDHKAVVDRNIYIDCRQGETFGEIDIEIDETFEETLDIAGLGETDTIAVTLKLTAKSDDSSAFVTMHTMQVDGDWVWFLTQEDYEAYESGECP